MIQLHAQREKKRKAGRNSMGRVMRSPDNKQMAAITDLTLVRNLISLCNGIDGGLLCRSDASPLGYTTNQHFTRSHKPGLRAGRRLHRPAPLFTYATMRVIAELTLIVKEYSSSFRNKYEVTILPHLFNLLGAVDSQKHLREFAQNATDESDLSLTKY